MNGKCPLPKEGKMEPQELLEALRSNAAVLKTHLRAIEEGLISDPCPECRRKDLEQTERMIECVEEMIAALRLRMRCSDSLYVTFDPKACPEGPGYAELIEAGANIIAAAFAAMIEDGRDDPDKLSESERKALEAIGVLKGIAKA